MKYTIVEWAEGRNAWRWAADVVEAAAELARKHGVALRGGEMIVGAHRLAGDVDVPEGLRPIVPMG